MKSFKAEKEIFELFARSNRALEKEKFGRERIVTIVGMIGAITAIFAQLGVFIAGAYFALKGYGLTPGAVILFVNLMNFTIEPIASLPGLLAGRKAANASRIEGFLFLHQLLCGKLFSSPLYFPP